MELAGREMRAELSVYEGRPVVWAAQLTGHDRDVLAYTEASPAPDRRPDGPAQGKRLVELRRSEMDALRLYVHLGARLGVRSADGLEEKVRMAHRVGGLRVLPALGGRFRSRANRFGREYGVTFRPAAR
ncbi:hypothetical protein [Streptomyces sp. NPDC003996]